MQLFLIALSADADSGKIYRWTDSTGQVHFSNTPKSSESKPADLPAIRRENIDQRIRTLKDSTPDNCIRHGGIDCPHGADSDGSVVCLDGYRDAIMPFQFECMEARLQSQFSVDTGGEDQQSVVHSRSLSRALAGKTARGLRLSLRNLSGVAAFGLQIEFQIGKRNTFKAEGPDKIEPYGSADYVLTFAQAGLAPNLAQIEQSEYKVSCTNCGAVMQSRGVD